MFLPTKSNKETPCVKSVMTDPVRGEVGALSPLNHPPPWVLPPCFLPLWPPDGICEDHPSVTVTSILDLFCSSVKTPKSQEISQTRANRDKWLLYLQWSIVRKVHYKPFDITMNIQRQREGTWFEVLWLDSPCPGVACILGCKSCPSVLYPCERYNHPLPKFSPPSEPFLWSLLWFLWKVLLCLLF